MSFRRIAGVLAMFALLFGGVYAVKIYGENKTPDWIAAGKTMKSADIPESDYPYLARWIDENSKSAQDYFIDLFAKHQVVIYGEGHNVKEHKDFIIDLIPRLYHEAEVRCIAFEFIRASDNGLVEQLVTAAEFDREAALDLARDQLTGTWNSKEHWDVIEAVWRLNNNLNTDQERMRLVGIFPDFDLREMFITMKTKPPDSPEYQKWVTLMSEEGDIHYARPVEKEIIEKGVKGLAFVGRCHDFTHHEFPSDKNMGRSIMGNILYKKYGDRIFQVWAGNGFLSPIEEVMALREHEPVGFDLFASPLANILSPPGWDAPNVPLSNIARGYIYLAPMDDLHANTPIKGFITDEMFEKYKEYYEIDMGRTFKNAQEVDDATAKRFSKPARPGKGRGRKR